MRLYDDANPFELADLYMLDETSWLDATSELIALGRYGEIDFENLREYLHPRLAAIAGN